MKQIFALAVIALMALAASGQTELKLERGVDPTSVEGIKLAGKFSANGYENTTLGFSIDAPVGFQRAHDLDDQKKIDETWESVNDKKPPNPAKKVEKPSSVSPVLFQYSYTGGGLVAGIERVKPGTTGRYYTESNIAALKGVSIARLSKEITERTLGGRTWQTYEVELTTNGVVVKQTYVLRVEGAYAIFFVSSYVDPEIKPLLENSLNSFKFVR